MASLDGYGLVPEFASKLSSVIDICMANGFKFKISQGLRTPAKQAEYYCKWENRKPADIEATAKKMEKDGAPWLAALLRSYKKIKRQKAWLTNALPGAGWHQWGEAADCYCYRGGKMVENGNDPCYKFFADTARAVGLTAGYYFTSQDSGHVQLSSKSTATSVFTWAEIDAVMKERFSEKESVALSSTVSLEGAMPESAGSEGAPKFYKDDPALINAQLRPKSAFDTSGASGALKALAETYNRVGGLLEEFGDIADIDPVAALAVWYVESGGRNFTAGRPVLRLENHVLFKKWGAAHAAVFDQHFKFGTHNGVGGEKYQNHAYRIDTSGAFKKSHVDDQSVEYEAFGLAQSLAGREAACWSSSWGGPQVMGFNHAVCGYGSADALATAFASDERWHVLGFADFCRTNGLIDEIQDKRWNDFGAKYNGNGPVYGPKIQAAYKLKAKLLALPRHPTGGSESAPSSIWMHDAVELETSPEAME